MLALLALGILALWVTGENQKYDLSIAAGQRSGQAFQLVTAIRTVTQRHHPEIRIEVFETRGSLQNARLLENRSVDMATTQSDLVLGLRAQLVAELYSDAFQLVVRGDSGIRDISDLIGKRIALPPEGSSEYNAFQFLAKHYHLDTGQMEVFPGTEATTDWLFINGDVDALFRVRAPGDASVLRLIEDANARIVAIPQAAALRLKQPALQVGSIPKGSYNGRPAVPATDLETIAARRLLVASEDAPADVVSALTSVLFERRRELIDLLPLAGQITAPDRSGGTILPVHAGAQAYYDRDQPSFLQENAEPIALMVSVLVILASGYLQLSTRRRKRVMDGYNRELLVLAKSARRARSFKKLDECDSELAEFVGRIVSAAEGGQINSSEFNLFQFTYEAVEDAIRDREQQLERAYREERRQEEMPRRRRRPGKAGAT
jgi:TRAP transporter TAXI family solute receptor